MDTIYKGTYEYYCPDEDKTFTLDYDMGCSNKLFRSNKKEDLWVSGVELWKEWDNVNELYQNEYKENKSLKETNEKEYKEKIELFKENLALKRQINQQHEELQEIKAKLKELLKE